MVRVGDTVRGEYAFSPGLIIKGIVEDVAPSYYGVRNSYGIYNTVNTRGAMKIVNCANCDHEMNEGRRALYDNLTEEYFCDRHCYDEWFSDNIEKISAEYRRDNVDEVDL